MKLTQKDLNHIESRGNTPHQIDDQFQTLSSGIPYVDLKQPATKGDGIICLDTSQESYFVSYFENKSAALDLLKFTPASGAATRMFKFLFEFIQNYNRDQGSINAYINRKEDSNLRLFLVGIDNFPFYQKVRNRLKKQFKKDKRIDVNTNRLRFIKIMLDESQLNFGKKPKGLFPFHKYKNHTATAFEEHLFEAALYATNNGVARIHFTISKEHHNRFIAQFKKRQNYIERKTKVRFDITYSYQAENSDTIALTDDKKLLRDEEGTLVFRPGGHGSLITNLNDQIADIVFIKNIDNVVVNKYKEQVAFYKKMLAGKLLELQEKSFFHLKQIDDQSSLTEDDIIKIVRFLEEDLLLRLTQDFEKYSKQYQISYLREQLNRPIRICGMVKNEGEPGGGPFWVRQENGKESLQIVESVQINPVNERQQKILKNATHFNPVDIVCGIKDYKGNKFNLLKFVDTKAGFITTKSYQGKTIKALEHPGLWNGAMAHWNTIFIEVPLVTFNPVKTVNDLLKPAHQVK